MDVTEVMDPTKIGYVAVGVVLTLLAMSVVSVTVFVERAWVLRRARRVSRECSVQVVAHLRAGRLDPALETARQAARAGGHLGPVLAAAISAGISEALITTAFGLFVAIPALWAHNSLADRAGRLERDAERVARELTDGLVQVG